MKPLYLILFLTVGLSQYCAAAPPEVVGTYIGTVKAGKLDHETGKMNMDINYGVEIKINADSTITYKYINPGNTYTSVNSIVGKSNFTFRQLYAGSTHLLIKGKFTGKGKKLKATYYWSNSGSWHEGKIAAKKF